VTFDVASPETELVDTYDDDGAWAGTSDRRLAHRNGAWHQCLHCVVIARQNGRTMLVLQRRGFGLEEYPGQIDVSVAGHLRAGESLADAAVREIREELGIDVIFASLEPLGEYPLVIQTAGLFLRERTAVFALRDDRPASAYPFDPVEVASLVRLDLSDAVDVWAGMRENVPAVEQMSDWSGDRYVAIRDFVNDVPDYWRWLGRSLVKRFGPSGLDRRSGAPPPA
jgi:8-oxo-dGTP pyrophosphatase MutT (NUDIX family)